MNDLIDFEELKYFYYLLIIPVLFLLFLWVIFWKKQKQKQFGAIEMIVKMCPDYSIIKQWTKFLLLVIGLIFITIALVNPKIGTALKTEKREGVDIVFALDISKSMLAEDIAPNRLNKSKQLVSQIINQLTN